MACCEKASTYRNEILLLARVQTKCAPQTWGATCVQHHASGRSAESRTLCLLVPKSAPNIFELRNNSFGPFPLGKRCSPPLLSPLSPCVLTADMVRYVVKKTPTDAGFSVGGSLSYGNSGCGEMSSGSLQAGQDLGRSRQGIGFPSAGFLFAKYGVWGI